MRCPSMHRCLEGFSNSLRVSVFSFGKDSFDFEYAPLLCSRLLITVITYKPLSGAFPLFTLDHIADVPV
jgi:hypothetical protein